MQLRRRNDYLLAAQTLAKNRHICCICRVPRQHVLVHFLTKDVFSSANLAVVCQSCFRAHDVGGSGYRYTPSEIFEFKTGWEETCVATAPDDVPSETTYDAFALEADDSRAYAYDLRKGDELVASICANGPVSFFIGSLRSFGQWEAGKEFKVYEEDQTVDEKYVLFVAPRTGTYLLWVASGRETPSVVLLNVAVWFGRNKWRPSAARAR